MWGAFTSIPPARGRIRHGGSLFAVPDEAVHLGGFSGLQRAVQGGAVALKRSSLGQWIGQLKLVQIHMKRLLDARARGEIDVDAETFEPTIYTGKQLRLIRKVLDKWRAHRSFSMSEVVLSNAVHVKEANIIRFVPFLT